MTYESSCSSSPLISRVPSPALASPVSNRLESPSPRIVSLSTCSPQPVIPELNIDLPLPTSSSRSPSPCWLMADLRFGRCLTPASLPTSLPASRPLSPVNQLTADISSDDSSSEDDEAVEAKRQKLDPDYQPSTASESPPTTTANSQEVSEKEEDETDTETEEESWCPSRSTSPEVISSPDDD
jgi:hypothetical protein